MKGNEAAKKSPDQGLDEFDLGMGSSEEELSDDETDKNPS